MFWLSHTCRHRLGACLAVFLRLLALPAYGNQAENLAELTLEQLLTIKVTSVARKEQRIHRSAAAVYVITSEEIRRSGLTSVPDLLRLAPGIHVAQLDAGNWAVSARGFNGEFANKLLVLVDGRSIYTPMFGGVHWDALDLIPENIEGIEVIRGPGATMWGANAVNGVINIITRRAQDVEGALVTATAGNTQSGAVIRHGGALGRWGRFYASGNYSRRNNMIEQRQDAAAPFGEETWQAGTGLLRLDLEPDAADQLTAEVMLSRGNHNLRLNEDAGLPFDASLRGAFRPVYGSVTGRWRRALGDASSLELLGWYSRIARDEPAAYTEVNAVDLETRYRRRLANGHELALAGEIRRHWDVSRSGGSVGLAPPSRAYNLYSASVSDEVALGQDSLLLQFGSRFEHYDLGGFQVQPTAGLVWTPSPRRSLWASVSRATRLPARYELDIIARVANLPPSPESMGLPLVVTLNGNRGIKPESVLAVESGYRIQLSNRISLDAAGFSNRYARLSVLSRQPQRAVTTAAPYIELPLMPTNSGQGWSHGLELSLSARLHKRWKLQGSYTGWRFDLFLSGQQQSGSDGISADPTHQAKIQSWLDLPGRLQLDALFFAASSLPARADLIGPLPRVPALGRLDLRLGWQANKKLHLSLHLQNGLDSRRLEYLSTRSSHFHEVRRGLFGKVAWTF